MVKEILKRLTFSFLITLVISMTYAWTKYEAETGNEARQAIFILVIATFFLCIINYVLSLTALLNLDSSIRNNFWQSFLSFFFMPIALFVAMLLFFLIHRNKDETITDFFILGYSTILYLLVLTYHFYHYRQGLKSTNHQVNSDL